MASVGHIFLLFAAPRRNGMGCDPTSQRRGLYVLTWSKVNQNHSASK